MIIPNLQQSPKMWIISKVLSISPFMHSASPLVSKEPEVMEAEVKKAWFLKASESVEMTTDGQEICFGGTTEPWEQKKEATGPSSLLKQHPHEFASLLPCLIILNLFLFLDDFQQCSGFPLAPELRDHSWDHMRFWGSNLGWMTTALLYYLSNL